MKTYRSLLRPGALSALGLLVSLGCQLVSSFAHPPSPPLAGVPTEAPVVMTVSPRQPLARDVPQPTYVAPTLVPVTEDPPAPTPVLVDTLELEYTYTENLVTALYHLYGTLLDHFVDVKVSNFGAETARIVIETEVDGFTTPAIDTVDVPAGETIEIHQDPRLLPEGVDKLGSQKPGNFHIRIICLEAGEEKVLLDETRQILIYARRDFVWLPGFEPQEEYELWAAWATPTDPEVEALIRAAANYDPTGIITSGYGGYTEDESGSVWRRLDAIWQAEEESYNLTYISTMTAFGPGAVQRIRLPAEVLDQASGNCIELALLFASAAEAISLEAAIIRVPGHAYTAIRTDQENAQYYFVETTMIGRASFSEAVEAGNANWEEAQPHFDAGEEGYAWVTIPTAREKGILPIPWH